MDIETFLIILLIQRQEACVTRLEATSIGQILFLAETSRWKPSANHQRFWNTVVAKYGRVWTLSSNWLYKYLYMLVQNFFTRLLIIG